MRRSSAARRPARLAALLLAGIVAALLLAAVARAATDPLDAGWESGWGLPGLDGRVSAFVQYRGDLIAGGDFAGAGGVHVMHVARWDGAHWTAVGDGLLGQVRALTVLGDSLIAACVDGTPGGTVFVWDGATWSPLSPAPGGVVALTVYRGALIAGCALNQMSDGRLVDFVVRWDGTTWSSLGGGVNGPVSALAVLGDTLIAGGSFGGVSSPGQSIARWDGATWSRMGDLHGLAGATAVTALAVHQGQLIAGGGYFFDSPVDPSTLLNNLARWDGSRWQPIGGGTVGGVFALASLGGSLVVGGAFDNLEAAPIAHLALWDGAAWHPLGAGVNGAVRALAAWGGKLAVGGDFVAAGDGTPLDHAATWDGAELTALADRSGAPAGLDLSARDLLFSGDTLLIAGDFDRASNADGWLAASGVALRSGGAWDSLGAGLRTGRSAGSVRTLARYGGVLYAGGTFDSSGASPAGFLARWDGARWRDLGPGLNGRVDALAVYRTGLYAVGAFVNIGNTGTDHIGRYEGGAWHSVGSGFALTGSAPTTMTVWRDQLVVAGQFAEGALTPGASNIALWDGLTWHPLGAGLNGPVYSLCSYQGSLVAGGMFGGSGATPMPGVARWDGYRWNAMGSEITNVSALATYRGDLVAAGWITVPGGPTVDGVARWDGAHWRPMGTGVWPSSRDMDASDLVGRLVEWQDRLWALGRFHSMGGHPANNIATWRDQNVPGGWPYSHPPLALASPSPSPAIGSATLAFQLPGPGPVEVAIFDVRGRRVATVASGAFIGGPQRVTWDGRDDDGRVAPAGVYFARLSAAGSTRVTRVVLLR